MVIDQQTAHERILYEKTLKRMDADLPFAQPLLFPKKLKPDAVAISILKKLLPSLTKLGFVIKISGKNTVIIEGVPEDVKNDQEEKILIEIVDDYRNKEVEELTDIRENLAKSYSSKTAVKRGDRLTEREMRLLIDQLFATSMPYICPNGRPTVVKISLDEFDRRFGRS